MFIQLSLLHVLMKLYCFYFEVSIKVYKCIKCLYNMSTVCYSGCFSISINELLNSNNEMDFQHFSFMDLSTPFLVKHFIINVLLGLK